MEVAIMRVPYPVWRKLIDLLWSDAVFMYCMIPRFLRDGSIEVRLLLNSNGGPRRGPKAPAKMLSSKPAEETPHSRAPCKLRSAPIPQERKQTGGGAAGFESRDHGRMHSPMLEARQLPFLIAVSRLSGFVSIMFCKNLMPEAVEVFQQQQQGERAPRWGRFRLERHAGVRSHPHR